MKTPLTVVKVGGKILEDPAELDKLLAAFVRIPGLKVLVHGGGRTATEVAGRLGVPTQMVEGRRVTTRAMLDVVTMVYGGLVAKQVVARLQALGTNALSLTGADAGVIRSRLRPVRDVDYGFVGDVESVDAALLALLLRAGVTPVMAPLTHDGLGNLLNTNADTIAGETAKALAAEFAVTLVYCFEHAGVLANAADEGSVIAHINRARFEELKCTGVVSGGMLPKIENCLAAVEAGVEQVIITSAAVVAEACAPNAGVGTRITK